MKLVFTLIPKADKNTRKENYRLMSLMNKGVKLLKKKKKLANQIQQHSKGINTP